MGAWIETVNTAVIVRPYSVASYVGAWIETFHIAITANARKSHPMWVRGLKLDKGYNYAFSGKSHPMWVRGLKHFEHVSEQKESESHPMWVRGLKPS